MKRNTILILLGMLYCCMACRKEELDIRDFGKVIIDSISPGKGPAGMHIIVYGRNFSYATGDATVRINQLDVPVVEMSPRRMVVFIPAGATTGALQFTFNRVNPNDEKFNYSGQLDTVATGPQLLINGSLVAMPIINEVVPPNGKAGDVIRIKGYNFSSAGNCTVKFGAEAGEIVNIGSNEIQVKVPVVTPGKVLLTISQGEYIVEAGDFLVDETPKGVKEIYWAAASNPPGSIAKATFDAFGNAVVEELYGAADGVGAVYSGIVVDVAHGWIYWAEAEKIYKGATDGQAPIQLIYTDPFAINDIAIDKTGKLYITTASFSLPGHHAIKKIEVDGSGTAKELYQLPAEAFPFGLKVDEAGGKIYWTEMMTTRLMAGSIEGETAQPATVLFDAADGFAAPAGIAIDPAAGRIYIVDLGNGGIYAGALDGSGTLQALPLINGVDIQSAADIEIDIANQYLYYPFTDYTNGSIMRCKTDGTGVQKVIPGVNNVNFIDMIF